MWNNGHDIIIDEDFEMLGLFKPEKKGYQDDNKNRHNNNSG